MSILETDLADVTPGGHAAQALLHKYGLGALFAANVLGAGSIYILSQTGASVGFTLLWVLPLAFAVDMVMHDMSSRLAVRDRPLMEYISDALHELTGSTRIGVAYAILMALVMQLWAVANYAVAGAAFSWFTGVNVYVAILAASSIGVVLVMTRTYNYIEAVISALLVTVFVSYAALSFGLDVNTADLVSGFVPGDVSSATLVIAMLGTTIYYPNFFIQSSMQPTKEWTSLRKYRRDNAVGIAFAILISVGMLVVAAVALEPGELSLTDPAIPLVDSVGAWTLPVFMAAVLAASFTSATGTLFGSSFAVPQSLGKKTIFGDTVFTVVTVVLIGVSSVLSILALEFTEMTPVRMAITMPALNGAIFLPVTILAMYNATAYEMDAWQKTVSAIAVVVMFAGSILTAESLFDTVVSFL
jgi:Mn2+/Fe2+ NRAMP family transporter